LLKHKKIVADSPTSFRRTR